VARLEIIYTEHSNLEMGWSWFSIGRPSILEIHLESEVNAKANKSKWMHNTGCEGLLPAFCGLLELV
jgi:hypothetical protein